MPRHSIGNWPYHPLPLIFYDYLVLNLSTRYIWKCPLPALQSLYDQHLSEQHLEIGVGTGYLLDHCRAVDRPRRLTLLDLNAPPLQRTRRRLRRYRPRACLADVLRPLPFKERSFGSVGMNFVIHCLPDGQAKRNLFRNIRSVMAAEATLFGSTVLASAKENSVVTARLMKFYNQTSAFHNEHDTAEGFTAALHDAFADVRTEVVGGVLLFVARS